MCSLTGVSPVILCLRPLKRLHKREHCVGVVGWGQAAGFTLRAFDSSPCVQFTMSRDFSFCPQRPDWESVAGLDYSCLLCCPDCFFYSLWKLLPYSWTLSRHEQSTYDLLALLESSHLTLQVVTIKLIEILKKSGARFVSQLATFLTVTNSYEIGMKSSRGGRRQSRTGVFWPLQLDISQKYFLRQSVDA